MSKGIWRSESHSQLKFKITLVRNLRRWSQAPDLPGLAQVLTLCIARWLFYAWNYELIPMLSVAMHHFHLKGSNPSVWVQPWVLAEPLCYNPSPTCTQTSIGKNLWIC